MMVVAPPARAPPAWGGSHFGQLGCLCTALSGVAGGGLGVVVVVTVVVVLVRGMVICAVVARLVILIAYLSYVLFKDLHVDPFLSVLIVAPFMFALGTTVQLVFIRSLRGERAEELSLLITWALALGIEGILGAIFQTTYRATNP